MFTPLKALSAVTASPIHLNKMIKNILLSLGIFLVSILSGSAQDVKDDYYTPYNFPDTYESDRLNRNFTLAFSVPPIGKGFYSILGYGDIGKISITEYLHVTYGLGFSAGLLHKRTVLYELKGEKAYDLDQDLFAKALAGGGLTFRLLNPVNFSFRAGFIGGYEQYSISNVRPYYPLDEEKLDKFEYKKATEYYFPISYFTNISVFVPLKKARLSLSYVNMHLVQGKTNIIYGGFVFPVSN